MTMRSHTRADIMSARTLGELARHPHVRAEHAATWIARDAHPQLSPAHVTANLDALAQDFDAEQLDDVDAHVLVEPQDLRRTTHHAGGKQVPLDLKEGVGADVQPIADHRVRGADKARQQDSPGGKRAEPVRQPVDALGKCKQGFHRRVQVSISNPDGRALGSCV